MEEWRNKGRWGVSNWRNVGGARLIHCIRYMKPRWYESLWNFFCISNGAVDSWKNLRSEILHCTLTPTQKKTNRTTTKKKMLKTHSFSLGPNWCHLFMVMAMWHKSFLDTRQIQSHHKILRAFGATDMELYLRWWLFFFSSVLSDASKYSLYLFFLCVRFRGIDKDFSCGWRLNENLKGTCGPCFGFLCSSFFVLAHQYFMDSNQMISYPLKFNVVYKIRVFVIRFTVIYLFFYCD